MHRYITLARTVYCAATAAATPSDAAGLTIDFRITSSALRFVVFLSTFAHIRLRIVSHVVARGALCFALGQIFGTHTAVAAGAE